MSDQKADATKVDQEHAGQDHALGQSGFAAAGSSGEAPPPFQLQTNESASQGFGQDMSEPIQRQENEQDQQPANGFAAGVDRVVGTSDADLTAAHGQRPEGWQSEIGGITTVDNEAINHNGRLTNPVGDITEARVRNYPGDVRTVQQLLLMHGHLTQAQVSSLEDLHAGGERHIPAETVAAIRAFQGEGADGVVDPTGASYRRLAADPENGDNPTPRGDRVEFTDAAENSAIEAEFEDELQGLEGDERGYMLELLSIYIGVSRDSLAAAGPNAEPDVAALAADQAGYDRLARHISNHTDPGGGNGDRSLVGSATIMSFLHEIGYWTDFPRRASAAAELEYTLWEDRDDDDQMTEGESREALQRLRSYTYSGDTTIGQSANAAADTWPWSAIFISHVMHQAGAGDTFTYDPSHSQYAGPAYQNTQMTDEERENSNEISNMFSADPGTTNLGGVAEPVQIGDLIHFARGRGAARLQGDQIPRALGRGNAFISHSDLVTQIVIEAPNHNADPVEYTAATLTQIQAAGHAYTIYAISIGGNTSDYQEPTGARQGARNNTNTAGKKYWPLNDNLTLQVNNAPGGVTPYGVMRLGPSVAAPAPVAGEGE